MTTKTDTKSQRVGGENREWLQMGIEASLGMEEKKWRLDQELMAAKITESLSHKNKQKKLHPEFLINAIAVSSFDYALICQFLYFGVGSGAVEAQTPALPLRNFRFHLSRPLSHLKMGVKWQASSLSCEDQLN